MDGDWIFTHNFCSVCKFLFFQGEYVRKNTNEVLKMVCMNFGYSVKLISFSLVTCIVIQLFVLFLF